MSCLFEIQNVFSAIRSSIDGKPTSFQTKQLNYLFDKICFSESESNEIDKIFKEGGLSNNEKLDRLRHFTSKRETWENKKNDSLLQLKNLSENEEEANPAIVWIESEIKTQKSKIWREKVKLKTDLGEILVIDRLLNTIKDEYLKNDETTSLFKAWTNDIFASGKYNGKISTFRDDIATDVTIKAKEVIGEEKWPEHQAKKYLNMLRHHIAGESFDYTWENGVLSSLFSVILAGEEWDKMLKFMQRKEMTDYRLAFAIYGTLNGFANLTRDFTDILLNLDEVYVKDVYKEFYGQLFSRDCGKIDLNNLIISQIETTNKVVTQKDDNETKQNIQQKNNSSDTDDKVSFAKDNAISGCNYTTKDENREDEPQQISLNLKCESSGYFYNDENAWDLIKKVIDDKETQNKIKKDFLWFVKLLRQPKGNRKDEKGKQYYNDVDEKDNSIVIEKFCSLKQGKNKNGKDKASYFTPELREKVKEILIKYYYK